MLAIVIAGLKCAPLMCPNTPQRPTRMRPNTPARRNAEAKIGGPGATTSAQRVMVMNRKVPKNSASSICSIPYFLPAIAIVTSIRRRARRTDALCPSPSVCRSTVLIAPRVDDAVVGVGDARSGYKNRGRSVFHPSHRTTLVNCRRIGLFRATTESACAPLAAMDGDAKRPCRRCAAEFAACSLCRFICWGGADDSAAAGRWVGRQPRPFVHTHAYCEQCKPPMKSAAYNTRTREWRVFALRGVLDAPILLPERGLKRANELQRRVVLAALLLRVGACPDQLQLWPASDGRQALERVLEAFPSVRAHDISLYGMFQQVMQALAMHSNALGDGWTDPRPVALIAHSGTDDTDLETLWRFLQAGAPFGGAQFDAEPLLAAASNGQLRLCEAFLACGADVNATARIGRGGARVSVLEAALHGLRERAAEDGGGDGIVQLRLGHYWRLVLRLVERHGARVRPATLKLALETRRDVLHCSDGVLEALQLAAASSDGLHPNQRVPALFALCEAIIDTETATNAAADAAAAAETPES